MSGLRFAAPGYEAFAGTLLTAEHVESCGIAYAHYNPDAQSWVVAAAQPVPDDAYERRDAVSAVLKPAFLVEIANHARSSGLSAVLTHTHPFAAGSPAFSATDDAGEAEIKRYLDRRAPQGAHLALVIGPDGCRARRIGASEDVLVWEVGERLILRSELISADASALRYDRQVRAFGAPGQRLIRDLDVVVIGEGGTGTAVLLQLAHLGVNRFTLIDPDTVEATNLNRLVGSVPADIGRPKVEVAARMIAAINPEAVICALQADVVDDHVAERLAAFDFAFLCTDSHASRAVVGQAAYQHLLPTIDMGVSVTVKNGAVSYITGRVQMLAPGLTCLSCAGALDAEQIRREMLTPEQRTADPYVQGVHEPQPAVISINSTMASLAVTMFLGAVTPIGSAARFQLYDGLRGTVRPTVAARVPHCIVCSGAGAFATGLSTPLPVRRTGLHHG